MEGGRMPVQVPGDCYIIIPVLFIHSLSLSAEWSTADAMRGTHLSIVWGVRPEPDLTGLKEIVRENQVLKTSEI